MNNTLNLQGERLGLFNPITGLDNKSFAKVKKNVKRLIHDLQRGKMESDSKKRSTSNRHQTLTGLFFFHRLIADFTPHKITARHSGTVDIFGVTVLALIEITLIGL